MKIIKTSNSRLSSTDFSRLPFGRIFSDHMLICHFKEGKWLEPQIRPYGPINMFPGTQVLHYGQSVFEGMKAFKNNNDEILIFRKDENFKRLNQSAVRLSIPEIPEDIFMILIKLPSKESATIFPSITLDCEKLIAGITKINEKKILIRKGSLIDEN